MNKSRHTKGDVGIEIEMEGPRQFSHDIPLDRWLFTMDGSLRGNSCEMVLPKPVSVEVAKERVEQLRQHLIKNKTPIEYSFRAGVHVHVNVQEMTLEQALRFSVLYYILEKTLLEWCGEDRDGNMFCLGIEHAEYPISLISDNLSTGSEENLVGNLSSDRLRYSALNWCAIPKYGSMEFRALSTQPDLNNVDQWSELLVRLRDMSLKYESCADIFHDLSKYTVDQWLDIVLTDSLKEEIKSIPNVSHKIFDSMWRVQQFGYHVDNTYRMINSKENKKKKVKNEGEQNLQDRGELLANALRGRRAVEEWNMPLNNRELRRRLQEIVGNEPGNIIGDNF